jgi:hypothetical protein
VALATEGKHFRPERTRISCHALETAAYAPFRRERRMKFANATKFHRKSGLSEWTCCSSDAHPRRPESPLVHRERREAHPGRDDFYGSEPSFTTPVILGFSADSPVWRSAVNFAPTWTGTPLGNLSRDTVWCMVWVPRTILIVAVLACVFTDSICASATEHCVAHVEGYGNSLHAQLGGIALVSLFPGGLAVVLRELSQLHPVKVSATTNNTALDFLISRPRQGFYR